MSDLRFGTPVTPHFSLEEFACKDGTPYPHDRETDGDLWTDSRLLPLCYTLEAIRRAAGDHPITVDSGYRTLAYDQKLYDADRGQGNVAQPQRSQHPQGRAADIVHSVLNPPDLFNLILDLYQHGELPYLGGIGLYPTFVHVDVRPRGPANHLAIWGGTRPTNIA